MTDVNIISTTQFTAYAPEVDVSRYDAPTLSGIMSQASKMVSDYLQYSPVVEVIADEIRPGVINSQGDLVIYPVKLPVITVTAISITKGATTVSLTLVDGNGNNKFNLDYTKRRVVFPSAEIQLQGVPIFTNFYSLRGTDFYTKITYQAGYQAYEIPESIKLATILYARDIISRSLNTSGATEISQGGMSMSFAQRDGKSDLVKDAERLLRPYRRIG